MSATSAARAAFEGPWLIAVVGGLALISVAAFGVVAFTRLEKLSSPPKQVGGREPTSPPRISDPRAMVALSPFGAPTLTDASSGELTLKAIFQGSRTTAVALVALRDGPAQSYHAGDQIGGARLASIAVDHLLLDTGASLVRLDFPKAEPNAGSDSPSSSPNAPPLTRATTTPVPPAISGPAESGQGYNVGPAPGTPFQRAGVRAGDVITSVNGLPVGDMERDLFDAVASGKARVEVQRDGHSLLLPAEGAPQ